MGKSTISTYIENKKQSNIFRIKEKNAAMLSQNFSFTMEMTESGKGKLFPYRLNKEWTILKTQVTGSKSHSTND